MRGWVNLTQLAKKGKGKNEIRKDCLIMLDEKKTNLKASCLKKDF